MGGGDTCTLASGIYVVQGGFNVGNGATLKTGSGGVLIYLMSGQFSINGGANVTFTAMTSGTYKGLVLWQAAADTQPISFSNGGALVFNGAIYGPKAQLQITGNAQTPIVTALVVADDRSLEQRRDHRRLPRRCRGCRSDAGDHRAVDRQQGVLGDDR